MQRRKFIRNTVGSSLALHPISRWMTANTSVYYPYAKLMGPPKPVFIYNNWSSYDELSDNIPLTEELAMKELNEIVRLRRNGVQIDYYLMDAFWFDRDGGYRKWNHEHWPSGPDAWLDCCKENHLLPGLWFSTNLISGGGNIFLNMVPAWQSSAGPNAGILCLFEGGYLTDLESTLQLWYDKGVRLFKFDFAYFEAATTSAKAKYSPEEIIEKNKLAFMQMLTFFRNKNQDVLILGYNGFGGVLENTFTPFSKSIDLRWLDVFDTLYSGDPRFSDTPMMNIWRSEDNYHDHQNRQFEFNGLPIRRIDSCAFMNGVTGTCYSRAMQCWKGMLILELARGGWINVYHGNLELISDENAKWFARAQKMFYPFQKIDGISSFGGIPGEAMPYGFKAEDEKGAVCTVVNPSQENITLTMPVKYSKQVKLLFADGGYNPILKDNTITLGPEQMAVVGFDAYAHDSYVLGRDETIQIPESISRIPARFQPVGQNRVECEMETLPPANIRIFVQQYEANGAPHRTWGGAPPNGKKMDQLIKILVIQDGVAIQVLKEYDKLIWSGLSWGAVEIKQSSFDISKPMTIQCSSEEADPMNLEVRIYAVLYK